MRLVVCACTLPSPPFCAGQQAIGRRFSASGTPQGIAWIGSTTAPSAGSGPTNLAETLPALLSVGSHERWSSFGQRAEPDVDGSALVPPSGRTRSSWLREVIPTLVKTFPRWYWTVRALMNRRLAISDVGSRMGQAAAFV